MKIEAPRGTHDVLPSQAPLWDWAIATAVAACAAYGYRRIVTPTLEETSLFARTSGEGSDIVQKEMYTFTDRGGRSMTLRPEGTAPVARAYLEHGLHHEPQPVKTFMVAPMFRYAAPQKGRYREHWQLSVEAIGSADPALDAELIQLYDELLRRLGIRGTRLELNSIGDRSCRPAYLAELEGWLGQHEQELDEDARAKRAVSPLRVFDSKNPMVQEVLRGAPKIGEALCAECREHFAAVRAHLDAYGVEYELVATLVRGLDYYTRTTFEFVGEALGAQSSIAGGGRYDYLVEEIGGPPTPAVGFATGLERIQIALEEHGAKVEGPAVDVFFICDEGADRPRVLAQMAKLRRAGVSCDTDYAGRSLRGQTTQAHRLRARVMVRIVGKDVAIAPRDGDEDYPVPIDEIAERLLR